MSLLIVGTIAFDTVETPWEKAERILGGSAMYAGYAASFFTGPGTGLVSVIGKDFPDKYLNELRDRGLNTDGVEQRDGKSFFWAGRYEEDVNIRTTLTTELNVLEEFDPVVPDQYRDTEYLFLANVDPDLQAKVLDQCNNLKFTILDTMNLWIDIKRDSLDKVLQRVNGVFINDEEARMLCNTSNLLKAARMILEGNPEVVIVKKGEHGVMMVTEKSIFTLPGYPLDTVKDPTGAGDTFAGGFIGHIAKTGRVDDETLRQAVVAGSVTASFCCEDFSIDRFKTITPREMSERFDKFVSLTKFEKPDVLF